MDEIKANMASIKANSSLEPTILKSNLSNELKSFLLQMLCFKPEDRISIDDFRLHEWFIKMSDIVASLTASSAASHLHHASSPTGSLVQKTKRSGSYVHHRRGSSLGIPTEPVLPSSANATPLIKYQNLLRTFSVEIGRAHV